MVSRKYAKFTPKYHHPAMCPEKQDIGQTDRHQQTSSFYNMNVLKAHLKNRSSAQDAELVDELFKENNDYLRKTPTERRTADTATANQTPVNKKTAMASSATQELSSILVQSNNSLKFNVIMNQKI